MATDRPAGTYGCPVATEAGSVTLNFLDGEGSTAAFGNRIAPRNPKRRAAAADHHAATPRKSLRGIASGSSRDRAVCVGLASVVMRSSTRFESSLVPWQWRRQGNDPRKARSECSDPHPSRSPNWFPSPRFHPTEIPQGRPSPPFGSGRREGQSLSKAWGKHRHIRHTGCNGSHRKRVSRRNRGSARLPASLLLFRGIFQPALSG